MCLVYYLCIHYAKPWPYSVIISCCRSLRYDSTLLGLTYFTLKVFLYEILSLLWGNKLKGGNKLKIWKMELNGMNINSKAFAIPILTAFALIKFDTKLVCIIFDFQFLFPFWNYRFLKIIYVIHCAKLFTGHFH